MVVGVDVVVGAVVVDDDEDNGVVDTDVDVAVVEGDVAEPGIVGVDGTYSDYIDGCYHHVV